MKQILYIDDHSTNLEIFREKFSQHFEITTSTTPSSLLNLLEGNEFDAILLDIHMPEKNGFEVLQEINESRFSSIPVLMYTSDELQAIRYRAFASSASDILYRTLEDEEIKLRIQNKINLYAKKNQEKKHLSLGSLFLNLETLEAFHHSTNLNLTPIEFKLLSSLVKNYPEKLSRDVIVKKAWNSETVMDRTVNTHLTNLRNKLPKAEFAIESPRGVGIVLRKINQQEAVECSN